ncbi:MAG: DUF2905 domain-containing protein [Deltaproteobacteria bacterium]|nr:DUF2905 domain-containing protein [Deltaproteobacteria bacterium]
MASFGKSLVFIGLAIAAVGALFLLSDKVGWIGRLPGDITIRRENFTFHFPLATCILISVIVSLVLYLFRK